MAMLDIFTTTQREQLINENVLINEANLLFYVDSTGFTYDSIPNRVYLYDLTNKRPLYDYYTDGSTSSNTKYNKLIYDGILRKDSVGNYFYRIRLTNHINNLVKHADSTNVKLGLVLTDDINTVTNQKLKRQFTSGTTTVTTTPTANTITPLGVKLYGPNIPQGDPDYKKRLRLQIFYTKPE